MWSTYMGGAGDDTGGDIAVDGGGNVVVTGATDSRAPAGGERLAALARGTGRHPTVSQFEDAFVDEVSADGSRLVYSSYLGGAGDERGSGVAVDGDGGAYVTGGRPPGPPDPAPLQPARRGQSDAFVARIPPRGLA